MTFTKSLKIKSNTKKGQAAMEYLIISALVTAVVWGALLIDKGPFRNVRAALQVGRFFQTAVIGGKGLDIDNDGK